MDYHHPRNAFREAARAPTVSVLMASYRPGAYVSRALGSVLAQSLGDLEIVVVDDGSDDGSVELVERVMERDPRVRLLRSSRNGGPARARNLALEVATGSWLAIVDADDIIHPQRFERLIAAAEALEADIVADDMLEFFDDGSPARLLLDDGMTQPQPLSAVDWILAGIRPGSPALGYLKPMFRARIVEGRRYDESLRIGEDFDFVLRLLLAGASAWVIPEPWYLYRKHRRSASHRLSVADRTALIASQNRLVAEAAPVSAAVGEAFDRRMREQQAGLRLERLVAAIKRRDLAAACGQLAGDPGQAIRLLNALRRGRMERRRKVGRPVSGDVLQLHLSDRGEATGAPAGAETVRVPAVLPPGLPAAGWRHRQLWRDLANRSRGRRLELSHDDPAGAYAAGFIPQDADPADEKQVTKAGFANGEAGRA